MRASHVLTGEEGPSEDRTAHGRALVDDTASAQGASGFVQGITKDRQENHGCNDRLESEEVLDLGIRNAQEGKLEQKVKQEAKHSLGVDALISGYGIWDVLVAWPDGCKQDSHTLTASRGLDTAHS